MKTIKEYFDLTEIKESSSYRPLEEETKFIKYDAKLFVVNSPFFVFLIRDNNLRGLSLIETVKNSIEYIDREINIEGSFHWRFPIETCQLKKGNCVDIANLLSSIIISFYNKAEFYSAFGAYKGNPHTYNIFIFNNKLYLVDVMLSVFIEIEKMPDNYSLDKLVKNNIIYTVNKEI